MEEELRDTFQILELKKYRRKYREHKNKGKIREVTISTKFPDKIP